MSVSSLGVMRRRRLAAHGERQPERRRSRGRRQEPLDGLITASPPTRRHVGLLVLHHFPDATYTSVAAQCESLHR